MICSSTHNCSFSPISSNNVKCTGSNVCSHTTIQCGNTSTCSINIDDTVDALVINASQVSGIFELKCNNKCKAVTVHCPDKLGSTCKCTNCNVKQTYYCTMGTSYCPSYQVTRIPHWNGKVWCKSGSNQMYFYTIAYYCPSIKDVSIGCRSIYTSPTSTYPYAPNDKCVAVNNTYYNTYSKRWYYNIYASSCRRTINATANHYEFYPPTCIEYESGAPPSTPVVCTVNKTRWLNKTLFLNKTVLLNKTLTLWVNKTRWINKTLLLNKTQTVWVNKTRWIDKCLPTNATDVVVSTAAAFEWSVINIFYVGVGILVLCVGLYIMWQCWLKDYVEEKLDTLCCCGLQGYIQPVKDACTFCCEFWHDNMDDDEDGEEETWKIEMQPYKVTEKDGHIRVEL